MKKIPSLGIRLLRNEWRAVEHNGATLVVGGVTDPWARRFGRELPDPIKAFAGAPEKGPRILLSHQPKHARKYDEAVRFDLQLSGHTHGGQLFALTAACGDPQRGLRAGLVCAQACEALRAFGLGRLERIPVRVGCKRDRRLLAIPKGLRLKARAFGRG